MLTGCQSGQVFGLLLLGAHQDDPLDKAHKADISCGEKTVCTMCLLHVGLSGEHDYYVHEGTSRAQLAASGRNGQGMAAWPGGQRPSPGVGLG